MKEYTVKVFEDGSKCWYLDGQRHREDGPSIEFSSGTRVWYLDGKRHREDGPAIEYADGSKKWCLNDKEVTEEEHKRRTAGITMDDALEAGDGVILREQAERIAELEERVSWLETTLDTVDAALGKWRKTR